MAYTGGVDPNFIVITHAPDEGREKRRRFIRHRVMLNYHAQQERRKGLKRRQKHSKGVSVTLSLPKNAREPSMSPVVTTSSESSTPLVSSIVRPPVSIHLLQPKTWTDAGHQQTSKAILRFLCGQVQKSVQNLSSVVFVHNRINQKTAKGCRENPLVACQSLLRANNNSEDLHSSSLWEEIYAVQENIYTSVSRCATMLCSTNIRHSP